MQVVGASVISLVQAGTKTLLFRSETVCTPEDPLLLTCPTTTPFFTASILWCVSRMLPILLRLADCLLFRSLIGPERQWGPLALYHPALWAFLIGAVLPVASWALMTKVRCVYRQCSIAPRDTSDRPSNSIRAVGLERSTSSSFSTVSPISRALQPFVTRHSFSSDFSPVSFD